MTRLKACYTPSGEHLERSLAAKLILSRALDFLNQTPELPNTCRQMDHYWKWQRVGAGPFKYLHM
eukprot:759704-Amorphochlora_amoeboformis.AAC.1